MCFHITTPNQIVIIKAPDTPIKPIIIINLNIPNVHVEKKGTLTFPFFKVRIRAGTVPFPIFPNAPTAYLRTCLS